MARTFILMAAMTALVVGIGYLLGGQGGLLIAFVIAAGMNVYALWNSDKAVLRQHGAQPLTESSAPDLFSMTRQLAADAGLPMPALYLLASDQPNAFATGRNPENSAVAVTKGLLKSMSREEVAGIVAHELAHIKNRDTLLMTVTATLAGTISMLANFAMFFGGGRDRPMGMIGTLAMMILAPMAAGLVQMAISRTREYEADRIGAEICGNPEWLASALERLGILSGRIDNHQAERAPASAHLFIVNPLHAHGYDSLFATHPPIDKRIAALRELGPGSRSSRVRTSTRTNRGPWE